MRIRVENVNTGEILNTADLKTGKKDSGFDILRQISRMQEGEDILGIGATGKADLGIKVVYEKDGVSFTVETGSGHAISHRGGGMFMESRIAPVASTEEEEAVETVKIDGKDTGIRLNISIYRPGYVIATGKKAYGIFGNASDAYITSIGTRNIKSAGLSSCRVFKDLKAVISYIEKNRDVFEYCVKEHGYNWSVKPSCDLFAADVDDENERSEKKATAWENQMEALQVLLEDINHSGDSSTGYDASAIPTGEVDDDAIRKEALYRMNCFDLWNQAVAEFRKNGTIFQSEAGGIVYRLDDNAKKACETVVENGCFPYHVVVTHTTLGEMYSVLYVSKHPKDWVYERGDKYGIVSGYCYNATDPLMSDYGSARFQSANGGIVRVFE